MVERQEDRTLLAPDFGDAPDTGAGTGAGNYETTLANGGASHTIVAGLFLGDTVDGSEDGTLQNARANADDVNGALPDDEDGVLSPATDLIGTIGAQPTVTVLVTNTTGSAATLAGWIDYNNNGQFDNATERATAVVNTGTTDGRVTLTFPAVPSGFTGTTYARFRLSTDAAFVASPAATGAASDGEVEDFSFSITAAALIPVTVDSAKSVKIASGTNGGPNLANSDYFGESVTSLGDVDGDGVTDLAVGAKGDGTGGSLRGAVYVQFMNVDGTVRSSTKIAHETGGGPTLSNFDYFGRSVASLGDLNGDGVPDLAVGSAEAAGSFRGAVHVLFMKSDGTVDRFTKIASGLNGGPALADFDHFGESLALLGDRDGDGVPDLAVGAPLSDYLGDPGSNKGVVYQLLMKADGTVRVSNAILEPGANGFHNNLMDNDKFGASVVPLGDLNGDGSLDLAVGAPGDETGGSDRGAVYVLLMDPQSVNAVLSSTKIAHQLNSGLILNNSDRFGSSLAALGDLNGDGVIDLGVGTSFDGSNGGAVHVLLLNSDGTVKSNSKIGNTTNGGPSLDENDKFSSGVASLGDLDGDGVTDLAVGAYRDNTNGTKRGAVYVLFLNAPAAPTPTVNLSVSPASGTEAEQTVVTVTATANAAVGGNQTVNLAVSGTSITADDFSLTDDVSGTAGIQIQILDGQTTGTVTFTITDDLGPVRNIVSVGEIG